METRFVLLLSLGALSHGQTGTFTATGSMTAARVNLASNAPLSPPVRAQIIWAVKRTLRGLRASLAAVFAG
jgi:hypothetical protein